MGEINTRLRTLVDELANGKYTVFAKKAGIPHSTFQNYIKNRTPHLEHLLRIHDIFRVDLNWLLTGKGEKFIQESSDPKCKPGLMYRLTTLIEDEPEIQWFRRHGLLEFLAHIKEHDKLDNIEALSQASKKAGVSLDYLLGNEECDPPTKKIPLNRPPHSDLVNLFVNNPDLAWEINWDLLKIDRAKPETMGEIAAFIKFKLQQIVQPGEDPAEENLANGTDGLRSKNGK